MAFTTYNPPLDSAIQLKDAGALTATATTQVGGVDASIDLGSSRFQKGSVVIDVSAIDVANGDEFYAIVLQGSNTSNFASFQEVARMTLGDSSVNGSSTDSVIGRRVMYWDNVGHVAAGEALPQRHLRMRVLVGGTTPSINFQAWATLDQ